MRLSRTWLLCLALALAVCLPGCGPIARAVLGGLDAPTEAELAKENDEYAAGVLSGKSREDGESTITSAQFFSDESKKQVEVFNRGLAKKLCENALAAGAPAAHVIVYKDEESEYVTGMILEMPKDQVARKKVIEIHNQYWKDLAAAPAGESQYEFEADDDLVDYMTKELKQKYLYVSEP